MTRRRSAIAVTAIVAVALGGAACSEPGDEDYCARLDALVDLDERLGADPGAAGRDLEAVRELRDVAPESVADDLDVIVGALERYDAAATAEPDPAERAEVGLRALQGDLEAIDAAGAALADDALDRCDLALPGATSASSVAGSAPPSDTQPGG